MGNFRVYWISLYMFRTVFPSIIRSSRLYTQHQVYAIQVSWLHASRHEMTYTWCCVYSHELLMMDGRPSETCRVMFNKLENCASSWFYYRNISRCKVTWTSKLLIYLIYLIYLTLRRRTTYIYVALWRSLTLRRLMSYIYGAPILDVSRSHTTTQHSR